MVNINVFADEEDDLDELIAIIAFEYGPEAACEMLWELEFSRNDGSDFE